MVSTTYLTALLPGRLPHVAPQKPCPVWDLRLACTLRLP